MKRLWIALFLGVNNVVFCPRDGRATTNRSVVQQVLNPQKGVSGRHSFKRDPTIWIYPAVTSWRSESRTASLVVKDELLFRFRAQ